MGQKGRPEKIPSLYLETVRELATAQPLSTLAELVTAFEERTRIAVHPATLSKALAADGMIILSTPSELVLKSADIPIFWEKA